VLDADGLNALAQDRSLQNALRQRANQQSTLQATVLTPHPLEIELEIKESSKVRERTFRRVMKHRGK
jgi:NAD(P)H-hydrate repair Nnr-like enzyme with NAD(P)H-hydrate dehydratase domain